MARSAENQLQSSKHAKHPAHVEPAITLFSTSNVAWQLPKPDCSILADLDEAAVHQQNVVDLSRKPKMIKHLPHRASEFGIEPIQERRLGWGNEIVVSYSGRGEQRRQHLVAKKKESTNGS
jgi:hypothetical protein